MRHLTIAASALAGLAAAANAQSSSAADVCKGMPTPAEEIACLRGALEESRSALSRERGGSVAAPPAAPEVVQQRQSAPAAVPTAPARAAERLGQEQVAGARREARPPEPEPDRIRALASAVQTDPRGFITLQLDNGQVWRQSEKPDVPLQLRQDRQYPVEIRSSGFGGYRMRFTEIGRQIAVRRVQ